MPPTVTLTVAASGREVGPVLLGWIFAAHQLGAGAFTAVAGASRDGLGTYVPSFLVARLLCLGAAFAFIVVRRPRPAAAPA